MSCHYTFVTIDELTLKDHDHSKSIAYFMVHAWCSFHSLDKCIMTWHAATTILLYRVFPLPQKSSVLHLFIVPFPQLLTTTDIFTVSTVSPFPECLIVKTVQYVLSHCLPSLGNMRLNFLFVVGVELYKLFVYSGDKALVGCIIYKYFSHFVGGLFVFFSLCKSL